MKTAWIADLVADYEAIFREKPSALTAGSLRALEHHLELTDNDPLVPLFIILRRVTDQVAASHKELTDADDRHRSDLEETVTSLKNVTSDLNVAGFGAQQKKFRSEFDALHASDSGVWVEVYGSWFPLAAYLREAFQWKNKVEDHNERVAAAWFDLFYTVVVMSGIFMLGLGLGNILMRGIFKRIYEPASRAILLTESRKYRQLRDLRTWGQGGIFSGGRRRQAWMMAGATEGGTVGTFMSRRSTPSGAGSICCNFDVLLTYLSPVAPHLPTAWGRRAKG